MNNIPLVHTNLDEEIEDIRDEFNKYVSQLMLSMTDKREEEELSIMQSR